MPAPAHFEHARALRDPSHPLRTRHSERPPPHFDSPPAHFEHTPADFERVGQPRFERPPALRTRPHFACPRTLPTSKRHPCPPPSNARTPLSNTRASHLAYLERLPLRLPAPLFQLVLTLGTPSLAPRPSHFPTSDAHFERPPSCNSNACLLETRPVRQPFERRSPFQRSPAQVKCRSTPTGPPHPRSLRTHPHRTRTTVALPPRTFVGRPLFTVAHPRSWRTQTRSTRLLLTHARPPPCTHTGLTHARANARRACMLLAHGRPSRTRLGAHKHTRGHTARMLVVRPRLSRTHARPICARCARQTAAPPHQPPTRSSPMHALCPHAHPRRDARTPVMHPYSLRAPVPLAPAPVAHTSWTPIRPARTYSSRAYAQHTHARRTRARRVHAHYARMAVA
ncbi:hypothetical protein C8R47DRAFT_192984 [Mycena vitilis]|nr:hypothetical protein C8R47DRAFT_192984 [Mycena vitilis]